jgi:flagellar biosynthesis protein FlhF
MVRTRGVRGLFGERVVEISAATERADVSEERPAPSAARPPQPPPAPDARPIDLPAGLDTDLAASIARHPRVKGRGVSPEALRDAVAETLAPLTAPDTDLAPVEVFVGPPGVGKTTTIAKIAAQARAASDARVWRRPTVSEWGRWNSFVSTPASWGRRF